MHRSAGGARPSAGGAILHWCRRHWRDHRPGRCQLGTARSGALL